MDCEKNKWSGTKIKQKLKLLWVRPTWRHEKIPGKVLEIGHWGKWKRWTKSDVYKASVQSGTDMMMVFQAVNVSLFMLLLDKFSSCLQKLWVCFITYKRTIMVYVATFTCFIVIAQISIALTQVFFLPFIYLFIFGGENDKIFF